jgi:hypothetical protein
VHEILFDNSPNIESFRFMVYRLSRRKKNPRYDDENGVTLLICTNLMMTGFGRLIGGIF